MMWLRVGQNELLVLFLNDQRVIVQSDPFCLALIFPRRCIIFDSAMALLTRREISTYTCEIPSGRRTTDTNLSRFYLKKKKKKTEKRWLYLQYLPLEQFVDPRRGPEFPESHRFDATQFRLCARQLLSYARARTPLRLRAVSFVYSQIATSRNTLDIRCSEFCIFLLKKKILYQNIKVHWEK